MSGSKGTGSIRSHRPKISVPVGSLHLETFESRLKKELINMGLFEPQEVIEALCFCVCDISICCNVLVDL